MSLSSSSTMALFTNGGTISKTFAYDHEGRVTAFTNTLGKVVLTDYDARGNVVSEDGATYPVRYGYDHEGRRISLMTTRDNGVTWDETTWTYDNPTGLCLAKTYADGSTTTYTYAPDGKPARFTYPGGKWSERVHDARGLVTNVVHSAGTTGHTNVIERFVDEWRRPAGYALFVDASLKGLIHYEYDEEGRIAMGMRAALRKQLCLQRIGQRGINGFHFKVVNSVCPGGNDRVGRLAYQCDGRYYLGVFR